jgi:acyl carrier protein
MTNRDKLKELLLEIFLIPENNFRWEMKREDIVSWDSLGTVAMAVGVHETFGYHFTAPEAMSIKSVLDIMALLETKGISFHD